MKFQIIHLKENDGKLQPRQTIVIKQLDADFLLKVRNDFENSSPDAECLLTLELGKTSVHPQDQYNKKLGVQLAKERVQEVICKIKKIVSERGRVVFTLEVPDLYNYINVSVLIKKKTVRYYYGIKPDVETISFLLGIPTKKGAENYNVSYYITHHE